jgi:Fic family protein
MTAIEVVHVINRATKAKLADLHRDYCAAMAGNDAAVRELALAEVAEVVHQSNAIENSTLTLEDTEAILAGRVPRREVQLREVFEATNLAKVMRDTLDMTDPLSVDLILRWHQMLLTGIRDDIAGRCRRDGEWVRIGNNIGANPIFVAELLHSLVERYQGDRETHFLDRIAWFHAEFETIHPFMDGNGRIGRVLSNYQLQQLGWPPIIVRNKGKYTHYYPLLATYVTTSRHDRLTRLLTDLLIESLHKRIAHLTSRRLVRLSTWAKSCNIKGNVAANWARRQTIPAFRLRDTWMIAEEFRS